MNKKIIDYIMVNGLIEPVAHEQSDGLEFQIKKFLQKGYQPYGSPFPFSSRSGAQAMVKYEEEKPA